MFSVAGGYADDQFRNAGSIREERLRARAKVQKQVTVEAAAFGGSRYEAGVGEGHRTIRAKTVSIASHGFRATSRERRIGGTSGPAKSMAPSLMSPESSTALHINHTEELMLHYPTISRRRSSEYRHQEYT